MIGAYQSSVTKTASQATERLKIPYVCSDSSSPTLTERGLKYFFRVSPHDAIFARDQLQFLKDLEKAKGQKISTIAALYENTEFGANVGKQINEARPGVRLQGRRRHLLRGQRHRRDQRGRPPHQGEPRRPDARLLHHRRHPLHQDLQGDGVQPRRGSPPSPATSSRATCPPSRPTANGIVVRSTFALDLAKNKPLVAKVNELFKKKYGIDMSENAARSFTAPFVLADAINRAKTTEAEAVVKALLSTNIPGDQVIYPWKGIQFDPQSHQNIHARGILVQIQNQNYVTVWPFESAAAPVIWPFPAWKEK